uniref:Uncharacterized protein LOC105046178 n=1 Tax=Elaeis guineensis var. tenera TaxID=51953 RepID=A0A6I9RAC9_ELAGV|nr:uncharacterized protein LOC105046178 [Elaeis guineensis]
MKPFLVLASPIKSLGRVRDDEEELRDGLDAVVAGHDGGYSIGGEGPTDYFHFLVRFCPHPIGGFLGPVLRLFSTPPPSARPPPRSCRIFPQPSVDVAGEPLVHDVCTSVVVSGVILGLLRFWGELAKRGVFEQLRKPRTISCNCSTRDQYYKDAAHGTGNMEKHCYCQVNKQTRRLQVWLT